MAKWIPESAIIAMHGELLAEHGGLAGPIDEDKLGSTLARPQNLEAYSASPPSLFELAVYVLDPVIDYFGMIKLTYGFCSVHLAKKIPGMITPKLDQHASCEINRNGNFVCNRLGAAVDFIVEDEDMLEVAQWIVLNTDFDRLYFYGNDKPLHISYGPEKSREIICMRPSSNGNLMPQRTNIEKFLSFN